jgi:hypothetical protein
MSVPSPLPTQFEEVRFTPDTGGTRKAWVTSFVNQSAGIINLFVMIDANDPLSYIQQAIMSYSSTITDQFTWHYISDEA